MPTFHLSTGLAAQGQTPMPAAAGDPAPGQKGLALAVGVATGTTWLAKVRNDPDIRQGPPWRRIDRFNIDDYYGHMYSASIAELKAQASAILRRVKAGEDVVVTDRGRPIARLTPYQGEITEGRLTELARQGLIALPTMPFPLDLLTRVLPTTQNSVAGALLEEREEGY